VRIRLALHYDLRRAESAAATAAARAFEALLEHAVAAEAMGIEVVRVAERPGDPDSLLPAALPVCAAIAARTRRLGVGTAVLPLPLHQPLRVAEDAASLDALSGGRFELGVGLGAAAAVAREFGLDGLPRGELLEEALGVIRRAWQDGPLDHAGTHFAVDGVEVWPKPLQRPGPPIWIGAGAAAAQRRAARLADGLLLAPGASPEAFLEAWTEAGRPLSEARLALPVRWDGGAADLAETARHAAELALGHEGVGRVDLVLLASPGEPGAEARLEQLLDRLRSLLVGHLGD
jgi:alkanesulfonate monooxygenase SsuD/methylene tetrahydromethanopterin reductase-like flavin-dependent oxidoreductase (luciferase family)